MPAPTSPLFKAVTPSSRAWLGSHFRDPYVKSRLSHPAQFRSRSAFKLLELHEKYGSFLTRGVDTVVDLGAAPGGWSQVVAGKMGWTQESEMESVGVSGWNPGGKAEKEKVNFGLKQRLGSWSHPASKEKQDPPEMDQESRVGHGTIIAADLLRIQPIPGVRTLEIDFLSPMAGELIHAMLMSPSNPEGKADLILSDMAANFTGNKVRDTEASLDICLAVFEFVKNHMRTVQETGKMYTGSLLYVCRILVMVKQYSVAYELTPFF